MIISSKKAPLNNLDKLPDVETSSVGNGISANKKTIEIMTKLARDGSRHPLVRRLATNIVTHSNIPSHHYLDEARAIGAWVQKHCRYVRDIQGVETLHSPDMMIRMMKDAGYMAADCDDMGLLTASLLLSIGIKPRFRAVRYRNDSTNFQHIYVVVYENNVAETLSPGPMKRLVIDCIVKDKPIGFEVPHVYGEEFSV